MAGRMERSTVIVLCVAIFGLVHQIVHAPKDAQGVHEPERTTAQTASSPPWTSSSAGDVSNITLPTASTRDITTTTSDITNPTSGLTNTTSGLTNTTGDITNTTSGITNISSDVINTTSDVTNTTSGITNTTSDITDNANDTDTADSGRTNTRNQSRLLKILLTLPANRGTNGSSLDERSKSVFPDSPADLNTTPVVQEHSLIQLLTFLAVSTTDGLSDTQDLNASVVTVDTLEDPPPRKPRTDWTVSTAPTTRGGGGGSDFNNTTTTALSNAKTGKQPSNETLPEHPHEHPHESRTYVTDSATATGNNDSNATVSNTTTPPKEPSSQPSDIHIHIPAMVGWILLGSVVLMMIVCCLLQITRPPRVVVQGLIPVDAAAETLNYQACDRTAASSVLTGRTAGRVRKSRTGAGTGAGDVEAPPEEGVEAIGMVPLGPVGGDDDRGGARGSSRARLGSSVDWAWTERDVEAREEEEEEEDMTLQERTPLCSFQVRAGAGRVD